MKRRKTTKNSKGRKAKSSKRRDIFDKAFRLEDLLRSLTASNTEAAKILSIVAGESGISCRCLNCWETTDAYIGLIPTPEEPRTKRPAQLDA